MNFSFGRFLFEYLDLCLKNLFERVRYCSFIYDGVAPIIADSSLKRFSCLQSLMGYNRVCLINFIHYRFRPSHSLCQSLFLLSFYFESNSFRPLLDISAFIQVFFQYLLFSGGRSLEFSHGLFLLRKAYF